MNSRQIYLYIRKSIQKIKLRQKNIIRAMSGIKKLKYLLLLAPLAFIPFNCTGPQASADEKPVPADSLAYLNHSDSARYVGMNTCKLCHQNIYNTFIKTGMGKSFDLATEKKSSASFTNSILYDKLADLRYRAYWQHDSLYINEFRLNKNDTVHSCTEQVNYIIGSGQHTNSHMHINRGYLTQMPMTFYTQKKKWDLPPGFENGLNTRFSRKIGLECMSCHNGYPNFVMGSENKYDALPVGIDCERCHGPGSIHVAQRQTGSRVDTALNIDYSIVNPAKLGIEAQFDVCQRCHLQGNAVLKDYKSFYDFKPGKKLSDYISVFLPKYKNADDEFIMASHADRLKQSACFIKSYEKAGKKNALKPYQGAMTCVTCHNPHVSVRETNKNVFNETCLSCHGQPHAKTCQPKYSEEKGGGKIFKGPDCVSCHMPVSGSIDIPHVSVHDHYIRKPVTKREKDKIKTFIGLYAINEKAPDKLTRARAYLNQYEKFNQDKSYLDSAMNLLADKREIRKNAKALIQLHFMRQDFEKIIALINQLGEGLCKDTLFIKPSYENSDAWACYRIAEAYNYTGYPGKAVNWFTRSVKLAPYNLEFRNKLGTTLAANNQIKEAMIEFDFILKQNPEFVSAYSNLGYIQLTQGRQAEALRLYLIGEKLDPDNEALLLNLAGYFLYTNNKTVAKQYLERVLKKNPGNTKVKAIMKQLAS